MFDLEKAVVDWRRNMLEAGIKSSLLLEELESHLRQDVALLESQGNPAAEAFQVAVARLGNPVSLQSEFTKLGSQRTWPVRVGFLLWAAMAVVLLATLGMRMFGGKMGFLLGLHIFTVTTGYAAGILAGIFGSCSVAYQNSRARSPEGQSPLDRAMPFLNNLAAPLTVTGLVLGIIWVSAGHHVRQGHELFEIGNVSVCVWQAGVAGFLYFGRIRAGDLGIISIMGSILVSLAWFGPFVAADHFRWANHWIFVGCIGIQTGFLLAGLRARQSGGRTSVHVGH